MITKLIHSDDQEELLRENYGVMQQYLDFDHGVKSASTCVTRDILNQYRPDKDHFGVHLIAMGMHPFFGPNKNADAFTKEACEKYHQTFVTHGSMFLEHNHRSKDLKIGDIKYATCNPKMHRVELIGWYDMPHINPKTEEIYESVKKGSARAFSMSCFTAGHAVRLPGGRSKMIEDVAVGDIVVTHKGNAGTVSNIMQRAYTGPGVRFRAYGLPDAVTCTADHGIWSRQKPAHIKECPVCGVKSENLSNHVSNKRDAQHMALRGNIDKRSEGFIRADYLLPGDYMRQAVDHRVTSSGDRNWAIVAGYYLSEGSISVIQCFCNVKGKRYGPYPNYRVEFCFHENESEYVEELSSAIEALGFKRPRAHHYPKEHRRVVRSHSKELHDWLLLNCGKYSHQKCLSDDLMTWDPSMQKVILEKWMEGDGTWHRTNEVISATTVSPMMAHQMMEIAARCGIVSNLGKYQSKKLRKKLAYVLSFSGATIAKLDFSKVPHGRQAARMVKRSISHLKHQDVATMSKPYALSGIALSFYENGFVYRRVRKVERVFINETVYDLTVPGDHGFTVNGIGVSNCRVPGDMSACCDNYAKTPSEYCAHMRNRPNQYISDLRKYAFVYNPEPTFFDISDVRNNADRTALYLKYMHGDADGLKAASVNGTPVITGAEWAKFAGVNLPDGPQDFGKYQRTIEKLAAEEQWIEANLRVPTSGLKVAFLREIVPVMLDGELRQDEINELHAARSGSVLTKLASTASLLPPRTFFSYVLNRPIADVMADPIVKQACCMLPGIFGRMLESGIGCGPHDIDQMSPKDDSFVSIDPGMTDPVNNVLSNASEKFSLDPHNINRRISGRIIIVKAASVPDTSACHNAWRNPAQNAEAVGLAVLYGAYKIASLHGLGHDADDKAPFLFAAHNYYCV